MKKKFVLVFLAVIVAFAVVMSYSPELTIDLLSCTFMAIAAGVLTWQILEHRAKTKKWIALIVLLWLAVFCLSLAGFLFFNGSIILAIIGFILLIIYGFLQLKK